MKNYQVFYWIKKNRHEYLEHIFVSANNERSVHSGKKSLEKESPGISNIHNGRYKMRHK